MTNITTKNQDKLEKYNSRELYKTIDKLIDRYINGDLGIDSSV